MDIMHNEIKRNSFSIAQNIYKKLKKRILVISKANNNCVDWYWAFTLSFFNKEKKKQAYMIYNSENIY